MSSYGASLARSYKKGVFGENTPFIKRVTTASNSGERGAERPATSEFGTALRFEFANTPLRVELSSLFAPRPASRVVRGVCPSLN